MEKPFLIGNWKSHKNRKEVEEFFEELTKDEYRKQLEQNRAIIAPPFTLLELCRRYIEEKAIPVELAAQDVSSYPAGPYTGEVNASHVKEFADYVIVGHSERRTFNHETDSDVTKKIERAKEASLTVIQCIQDEKSMISQHADIVAFEPPSAISTFGGGSPDDPEHVKTVLQVLSETVPNATLIYGGSIDPENVVEYRSIEHCRGFLVGSASLNASSFTSLL